MKVVINRCHGGFSVSRAAMEHMGRKAEAAAEDIMLKDYPSALGYGYGRSIPRNDAALVRAVEDLGDAANGRLARLAVIEIPDGVDWRIDEYDGFEHVAEGRTWG